LLVGVEAAPTLFNVVFFVVVTSVLLQGVTARPLSRWLGIQRASVPLPSTVVEVSGRRTGKAEVHAFWVHPGLLVCGMKIGDIVLTGDAAITMLLRGDELLPARGDVVLQADDHVYVLCAPPDLPLVRLMFGRSESEGDD
jgi:cell volume regulation protein A